MSDKKDTLMQPQVKVEAYKGYPPITTKFMAFTSKYCKPDCFGYQLEGEYINTTTYAGVSKLSFDMKITADATQFSNVGDLEKNGIWEYSMWFSGVTQN